MGVEVAGVVDVRPNPQGDLITHVKKRGIKIFMGYALVGTKGWRGVVSATISSIDLQKNILDKATKIIDCDIVAVSGGWSPVVHLHSQSGGKLKFDNLEQCFVPHEYVQKNICIGAANGVFNLTDIF